MNSKWLYIFAVIFLLLLRLVVLNTQADVWLMSAHFTTLANIIATLRGSGVFVTYVGNWALPVFVAAVMVFWLTEQDGADHAKQFLLLPIVYVPFSIVGMILQTAVFEFSYLYVHPLVILPFGYIYIFFWVALAWLLGKLGLLQ